MSDDELLGLWFFAMIPTFGFRRARLLTRMRYEYLIKQHPRYCARCRRRLYHKECTIDHIIPESLAWELDLPNLIIDERNFQILCGKCNNAKGNAIDHLSLNAKLLIEKRRMQLGHQKPYSTHVDSGLSV